MVVAPFCSKAGRYNGGTLNIKSATEKQGISISYKIPSGKMRQFYLLPQLNGGKMPVSCRINWKSDRHKSATVSVSGSGRRGSFSLEQLADSGYIAVKDFKNISNLKIALSSEVLVLPDKRSEDIVIYAKQWKKTQVYIPGDNYLALAMLNHGSAMLNILWNSADVRLVAELTKDRKEFAGLTIKPQRKDIIWLGISSAKHIWYSVDRKLNNRPVELAWKPPFPAIWQVTMRQAGGTEQYDSWAMADFALKRPKPHRMGVYIQNSDGATWASGIGSYTYPFAVKAGKITLRYPSFRPAKIKYDNAFKPLIYPVRSIKASPTGLFLSDDMLAKTLAPEAFKQLSCKRAKNSFYPATCGVTAKIEKIFYRDESTKEKTFIAQQLNKINLFIKNEFIRANEYLKWEMMVRRKLDSYRRNHHGAAGVIATMQRDIAAMVEHHEKVKSVIKTESYFRSLTSQIVKLIGSKKDAEEKERVCKELCRKIRTVGSRLDHLLAEFREEVKAFRAKTTMMLMQPDPVLSHKFLKELRQATAEIMHYRFPMEGK
jgi:hypothetical protein